MLYSRMNSQCQKQPVAFKRPERQLYFRWYLSFIISHPAFLIWAGRTNGKKKNTELSANSTFVIKRLPFTLQLWLFCSCEMCAELHSCTDIYWALICLVLDYVLEVWHLPNGLIRACWWISTNDCTVYCKNDVTFNAFKCIAIFILLLLSTTWFPFLPYRAIFLENIEWV